MIMMTQVTKVRNLNETQLIVIHCLIITALENYKKKRPKINPCLPH